MTASELARKWAKECGLTAVEQAMLRFWIRYTAVYGRPWDAAVKTPDPRAPGSSDPQADLLDL